MTRGVAMWVSEDVDGLFVRQSVVDGRGADDSSRWVARHWLAAVFVAITVLAVIALVLWVPGAFASPSGGCGG